MDSAAASLLEALHGPDHRGLYDRVASFLLPFGDLITLDARNPGAAPKKSGGGGVAKPKPSSKKKRPEADPRSIRPLAKQFLPFLCRALQLLPAILRRKPKPPDGDGCGDEPQEWAAELLGVYGILLECLACIGPCLAGKPYSVLLQRGQYVCCLEAQERYVEAEEEALSLLESLRSVLIPAASVARSQKRRNADARYLLPDPELIGCDDPELTILVIEVIISLANCSSKCKTKNGAAFERILTLVEQVQPWLRLLDPESLKKYHWLLVNALYRCSNFLALECTSLNRDLVQRFCMFMLRECAKPSSIDRFPIIARKICSSIDLHWEGRSRLMLDMLKMTLESIKCGCKVRVSKFVNELLDFVLYSADSLSAANMDILTGFLELFYEKGGDFLEVSPPIASILILYATGLYFISNNIQVKQTGDSFELSSEGTSTTILPDNAENLQKLTDSLGSLANYFHIAGDRTEIYFGDPLEAQNESTMLLKTKIFTECKNLHGNASFISYLDALEFLCKILHQYVNTAWKFLSERKMICQFVKIDHVLNALHQFCDSMIFAFRCVEISEKDKERLQERRGTLLEVVISAFRISFLTTGNYQKSLSSINYAISSEWIKPQELRFLISALSNIGASLYNIGHFKQAPIALQLCCQAIWAHVKLRRRYSDKLQGFDVDGISKDSIKDITNDAFTRIATIVDTLHRCGAVDTNEIVVESLFQLSAAEDVFENLNGSLVLVKQWVKIMCKDFEGVDMVDDADVLYSSLLRYCPKWPKKIAGMILEQELLAYDLMEARNPVLCKKMKLKVVDILLNDMYLSRDCYLGRSRVLVSKAKALRACGIESINDSLKCLSEAICLLKDISLDSSGGNATIRHQLAIAYCLHAQCAQEANLDFQAILQDVQAALNLWLSLDIQGFCSIDGNFEMSAENMTPLLCSIIDLLAIKGCLEFQFDICKLLIMVWKRENIALERFFALLWNDRRLNHSFCTVPMDGQLVLNMSHHFGVTASSVDFWISCIKGHQASLCMFHQKVSLTDSIFPELSDHGFETSFGHEVSVDEVKRVASSLVSAVPLSSQSAFLAGCLYYDLGERLLSKGRFFEALCFSREALRLRKRLLKRKFIYYFRRQQQPQLQQLVSAGREIQTTPDLVHLEAMESVMTETWPDHSRSGNIDNSFLTPWAVLRCYLESILQVGIIHESTGDAAEAEILFRTGKELSHLQSLPTFGIAFSSLLGQLYRKKHLWDLAETELSNAKKLLAENDTVISCKNCKLTLEVAIHMQAGDLARNLFEKGIQSVSSLSNAISTYRSALEKINNAELRCSHNFCDTCEVSSILISKDHAVEAKGGAQHCGAAPSLIKEARSCICSICLSLHQHSSFGRARCFQAEYNKQSFPNPGTGESLVNIKAKKTSRNASKGILKVENSVVEAKTTRTRSRKRLEHKKIESTAGEVDCNYDIPVSHDFCADPLSAKCSENKLNTSCLEDGCNREDKCNKVGCWSCFLIKALNAGSLETILFLKWECHRRRILLILLLKIARSLGAHGGKHGAHEVHDVYWQSISLLFYRSISFNSSELMGPCLIELIAGENLGDVLSIERAAILYNMSLFSLKGRLSEQPRGTCCCLSNVLMSDVVAWLLRAFIISQQFPSLLQKVCRLLASIYLLSTLDCSTSLPLYSEKSLSLNHWAAYFHQASLGTFLHHHYFSSAREAFNNKVTKDCPCNIVADADSKTFKCLRYSVEKLEHLEEHITDFFRSLPRVPIICISMLGGDYANLVGETLLLPSFFPAWLLLSRLDSTSQPITMLLPVDIISEELQTEDATSGKEFINTSMVSVKSWKCPWSYTVLDYVAPSFKQLLEENFVSLSSTALSPTDGQLDLIKWWSQRTKLNNCLDKLLKIMEESWLGPWGCLLLGEHLDHRQIDMMVSKLIDCVKSQFKFEVNLSLVKAILCGAKSVADAEACFSQLVSYKGYFGRGACCGKERIRAFSVACQIGADMPDSILELLKEAIDGQVVPINREPVILVLDTDVQMLPWENLPLLRSQEIYRMPSVGSIHLAFDRNQHLHKHKDALGACFPVVDPFNAYYLLNPSGDLNSTQVEFEMLFKTHNWEGKAGKAPTTEELVSALRNHDLFLYFGHGSGIQYIPGKEIEKLDQCAATLLMGCSSGTLLCRGCYAPQGVPLSYLFAGSPAIVANLWDVSDKDIDRFGKAILNSWLDEEAVAVSDCSRCSELVKEFGCMKIDGEGNDNVRKTRRKGYRGKKSQPSCEINKCHTCGRKRIASYMSRAREACKLPLLIGASPVCYGVPTLVGKKPE